MPEPQQDPILVPVRSRSRPNRRRIASALLMTALVIVLPRAGARVAYWQTGETIERDLVRDATWVAAMMCALAWCGLAWARYGPRPRRLAAFRGKSARIANPELVRALLNEHELTCAGCGYNLKGLTTDSCPECRAPVSLRVSSADCSRSEVAALALLTAYYLLSAAWYGWFVAQWLLAGPGAGPRGIYFWIVPAATVLGSVPIVVLVARWLTSRDFSIRVAARARAALTAVTILILLSVWMMLQNLLHLW